MMEQNEIRRNIASNIICLRVTSGMTQAQLAEKLNYSDKAVSKWERAESIPDVTVLKHIADIFGVSMDWLIRENGSEPPAEMTEEEKRLIEAAEALKRRNRLIISLLSAVAVLFVVTVCYVSLAALSIPRSWLPFVWGIPATAIDLLVFNAIWGKYKYNFVFISFIIWTLPAALFVTLADPSLWFIFIFPIPLQVGTIFWSQLKRAITPMVTTKSKSRSKSKTEL